MTMAIQAVILLFTVAALYAEACDLYEFERCLTDFTDKYPEASDSFSPKYTEQQLVSVCKDFDIAATCARSSVSGCSRDVKVLWEVLDNVMTYMCSEETKLILRNSSDCIEGEELQADVRVCNSSLQATTDRIKRYGGTQDELCSAMKKFAFCTTGAAERHCGSEVSRWYGGLVDAALDPTKGLIDCYFTAGCGITQHNGLLISLALVLALYFIQK